MHGLPVIPGSLCARPATKPEREQFRRSVKRHKDVTHGQDSSTASYFTPMAGSQYGSRDEVGMSRARNLEKMKGLLRRPTAEALYR